jgi:Bacterial regulatory proteins, tetR family
LHVKVGCLVFDIIGTALCDAAARLASHHMLFATRWKNCQRLDYKQTGLYTYDMGRTRETSEARQRILETADRLFYQEGVRAVGIDRIIAEAGVAKMSLYKHFPSKDDLILAVLKHREEGVLEFFRSAMERHGKKTKNPLGAFWGSGAAPSRMPLWNWPPLPTSAPSSCGDTSSGSASFCVVWLKGQSARRRRRSLPLWPCSWKGPS